jgi:hypothetical protein
VLIPDDAYHLGLEGKRAADLPREVLERVGCDVALLSGLQGCHDSSVSHEDLVSQLRGLARGWGFKEADA